MRLRDAVGEAPSQKSGNQRQPWSHSYIALPPKYTIFLFSLDWNECRLEVIYYDALMHLCNGTFFCWNYFIELGFKVFFTVSCFSEDLSLHIFRFLERSIKACFYGLLHSLRSRIFDGRCAIIENFLYQNLWIGTLTFILLLQIVCLALGISDYHVKIYIFLT